MIGPRKALAMGIVALWTVAAWGQAQSVKPGINKPFENPDIKEYVKKFESNDREVFAQRAAIVKALRLRPGMAVADIGAGTGLFTRLFAERVGTEGKVFAVDISQTFLAYIAAQAKERGQSQVRTLRSTQETTNLPAGSIDLAFLCDVYHHLEFPAKSLASIHRALKPGGALAVIEFDRRKGVSRPFLLEHVRASKEVFQKEIEAAGFERIEDPSGVHFKENFFMRFRKKDHDEPAPRKTQP